MSWEPQVAGYEAGGQNQQDSQDRADFPRATMETDVDSSFGLQGLALRHELGTDKLESQGNGRQQHQQRVYGGRVAELYSSEPARNQDVVEQIDAAHHGRTDEHDHAATEEPGTQSARRAQWCDG